MKNFDKLNKENFPVILVNLYIVFIFLLQELFLHDGYFDLLITKFAFFAIGTVIFALAAFGFDLFLTTEQGIKIDQKIAISYMFYIFAFMVSCLLSDYRADSFIGNMGRYRGAACLVLYFGVMYIASLSKKISRLTLCILGAGIGFIFFVSILNASRLDPLLLFRILDHDSYYAFTTTIGNMDTYGEYVAIICSLLMCSYIFVDMGKKAKVAVLLLFFEGLLSMMTNNADASFICLVLCIVFIPLFIGTKTELLDYVIILITISISVVMMYVYDLLVDHKPLPVISQHMIDKFFIFVAVFFLLMAFVFFQKSIDGGYGEDSRSAEVYANKLKIFKRIYLIVISIFAVLSMACVFIGNIKPEVFTLPSLLVFNDEWGSNRGYLWKYSFEEFSKFSLKNKLFGIGPDCLYYLYENIVVIFSKTFDNVHNSLIQCLLSTGIVGLVSYLVWIYFVFTTSLRVALKDKKYVPVLFAICGYFLMSLVGIQVTFIESLVIFMIGFI